MEDMNSAETIRELSEQNTTRKILLIMKSSEDLTEAIKKVESLLEK